MTDSSVDVTPVQVSLIVTPDVFERFCLLTGDGFRIRTRLDCSVRELLCLQLGVDSAYLDDRIQTIFLNGRVVDDPDVALVVAGSTLALSAAMPGIAGAMLRKKSRYAPMRSGLSYTRPSVGPDGNAEGDVVVKLFNLLQRELGPQFLRRGIRIPGRALHRLLEGRWRAFRAGIVEAEISAEQVEPNALLDRDWANQELVLIVRRSGE